MAPHGFLVSGDAYNQSFDAIILDLKNKVKRVDYTCIRANSIEASLFQACEWLDMCACKGITLNSQKFQFALDKVDLLGLPLHIQTYDHAQSSWIQSETGITGARAWFWLIMRLPDKRDETLPCPFGAFYCFSMDR